MRLTRKNSPLIAVALILLLSFFGFSSREISEIVSGVNSAVEQEVLEDKTTAVDENLVTRIVDGDTIEISGKVLVRYIGIDTPETVDLRKDVQCFGKEASNENKRLVLGKKVTLEKDVSETDRYGRLLRYVYIDGKMVNEELVKNGYARAVSYPPDIKYQDAFAKAEESARKSERGLWSTCN